MSNLKERRMKELLQAAYDIIGKQEKSHYVLNVLEQTTRYDDADCDGSCLLDDIADVLGIDRP